MAKAASWMPLYVGDYVADTGHLSCEQHGAYLLLLMHQWRCGFIPSDDGALAAICRVTKGTWLRSIAPAVRPFFQISGSGLVQKRLHRERENALAVSEKRAAAARAKYTPKDQKISGLAYANGHAKPDDLDIQKGTQSQSQSQEEAKQLLLAAEPADPKREPPMPKLTDPPDAWTHLADRFEWDDRAMVKHPVVSGTFLDVAAERVCDAAGIRTERQRCDWRPLIAWLRDGLDLHDHILPAISAVATRRNYRPPHSLAYFDEAVRERRAA